MKNSSYDVYRCYARTGLPHPRPLYQNCAIARVAELLDLDEAKVKHLLATSDQIQMNAPGWGKLRVTRRGERP